MQVGGASGHDRLKDRPGASQVDDELSADAALDRAMNDGQGQTDEGDDDARVNSNNRVRRVIRTASYRLMSTVTESLSGTSTWYERTPSGCQALRAYEPPGTSSS